MRMLQSRKANQKGQRNNIVFPDGNETRISALLDTETGRTPRRMEKEFREYEWDS